MPASLVLCFALPGSMQLERALAEKFRSKQRRQSRRFAGKTTRRLAFTAKGEVMHARKTAFLWSLSLAAVACSKEVSLRFDVPVDLDYQSLRLMKIVNDQVVNDEVRPAQKPAMGQDLHSISVVLPRKGLVVMRAQAIDRDFFVAQGEVPISGSEDVVTMRMGRCEPKLSTAGRPLCASSLPPLASTDGGVDVIASPDLPADGDGRSGRGERPEVMMCRTIANPEVVVPLEPVTNPSAACRRYCDVMLRNCPAIYRNDERCLIACTMLDWPEGQSGDADRHVDTIACRIAWAETKAPTLVDRIAYCERASPDSLGHCGATCEVYCRMGEKICGRPVFGSEEACRDSCRHAEAVLRERNSFEGIRGEISCQLAQLEDAIFNRDRCTSAAPHYDCSCPIFPDATLLP